MESVVASGFRDQAERKLVSKVSRTSRSWLTPNESHILMSFVKFFRNAPGEMAEVGVSNGSSAKLICEMKGDVPIHLFDTFDGLPETCENDKGFFKKGMFKVDLGKVQEFLAGYENVFFHQGLFPDSGIAVEDKEFSFVFIDVDLYESTKSCLDFFSKRMVPGGVIMSHDYQFPGVKKAFKDAGMGDKCIELADSLCVVSF